MGRATGILVPSRFLLTVGHFITVRATLTMVEAGERASPRRSPTALPQPFPSCCVNLCFFISVLSFVGKQVVMAFYAVDANVGATFAGRSSSYTSPTASEVSAAKSSLTAALSLSIICLAVCFVGLFGGFTLMFDK